MRGLVPVLLLLPVVSWAGDDLKKASRLLDRTRFVGALKIVHKTLKRPDLEPQEIVEAYRIEGLCLAALGRRKQARQSFQKLLAISPAFRLSRDVSPKLARPFRWAAEKEHKPPPIRLTHSPPERVESLAGQVFEVKVEDDALGMVASVRLRYRLEDGEDVQLTAPVETPGAVSLRLPDSIDAKKITYHIDGLNQAGAVLIRCGSPVQPFRLATLGPVTSAAPVLEELPVGVPDPPPAPGPDSPGEKEIDPATPWYKAWWFWAAVGAVVVAGAATGTALALDGGGGGDFAGYRIRFE